MPSKERITEGCVHNAPLFFWPLLLEGVGLGCDEVADGGVTELAGESATPFH